MKKLLSLVLTLVFVLTLTGCGGDKVTTASCTYTDDGTTMSFDLSATNDEIDKVKMIVVPANSSMGITSFKDVDDETKEQIKKNFLSTYGLDKQSYDGLEIKIEFDDNVTITFDADLKVADKDLLKKIGMDFEGQDMSLDKAIQDFEEDGFTCKK